MSKAERKLRDANFKPYACSLNKKNNISYEIDDDKNDGKHSCKARQSKKCKTFFCIFLFRLKHVKE